MNSNWIETFRKKLEGIRCLALDVDGILTDSRVFWIQNQGWTRQFSVRDGYGMAQLKAVGIELAVISASNNPDLLERIQMLGIKHAYLGSTDKLAGYEKLLRELNLKDEQMAFMGDDVFDLPVLKRVGFSASVPDALDSVKRQVHYISNFTGGMGAVREVADGIRFAQGHFLEGERL